MVCGWLTLNQSRPQSVKNYKCREIKAGHSYSWSALGEWALASLYNYSGLCLDLNRQVITSVVDWHSFWNFQETSFNRAHHKQQCSSCFLCASWVV